MFHVEIRQFPHSARAFNLERSEVDRLLRDWLSHPTITWGEHEWESRKAKLTILDGPTLETSELGMGRGWPEAQRRSRDVTAEILESVRSAPPPVSDVRPVVRALTGEAPSALPELIAQVAETGADPRVGEAAVWALLQAGELELVRRRAR